MPSYEFIFFHSTADLVCSLNRKNWHIFKEIFRILIFIFAFSLFFSETPFILLFFLCIYFLIIVFRDERPAMFTSHTMSIFRARDLSHYYSFLSSGSTVLISSVFHFKTSTFPGFTSIARAVAIFLVCPSFHICPESSLESNYVKGYTN